MFEFYLKENNKVPNIEKQVLGTQLSSVTIVNKKVCQYFEDTENPLNFFFLICLINNKRYEKSDFFKDIILEYADKANLEDVGESKLEGSIIKIFRKSIDLINEIPQEPLKIFIRRCLVTIIEQIKPLSFLGGEVIERFNQLQNRLLEKDPLNIGVKSENLILELLEKIKCSNDISSILYCLNEITTLKNEFKFASGNKYRIEFKAYMGKNKDDFLLAVFNQILRLPIADISNSKMKSVLYLTFDCLYQIANENADFFENDKQKQISSLAEKITKNMVSLFVGILNEAKNFKENNLEMKERSSP